VNSENNEQITVQVEQRCYYPSFSVGTDEKKIIDILCYRSNAQRQELKIKYKSFYGMVSVLSVARYHC